ncbi:MAG TPA: peptidoglycan DD-metalloendopeptidase family protein [Thermoanaerobaculia bacterium]
MKILRALGERLGGVVRLPRAYFAVVLPIAIPLVLAAVNLQPKLDGSTTSLASAVVTPDLKYTDLAASPSAELPEHAIVLTFEQNDTLDAVLLAGGLSRSDSAVLTREFAKHIDVRRLRPGHLMRFHYDANDAVDAIQMKVTGWGELNALRRADGGFDVSPMQATIRDVQTVVSSEVTSSLYEALRRSGEGPGLVQQLADVFQWDIDFFELRNGDSFSLVVTKRYAGNDLVGYGPITAARFNHRGNTYEAFRHEHSDGRAGYYARTGAPLKKQFLKAPLKFPRLTSGFSKKRFHPVLKYFRPHYGVDYGAPVGTPVMTTADGVVLEAGYKGGEGNYVRIRHSSRIETYYLHLSRFAKDVKKGTKVTQGDVIGYVGKTGLATGPHLDYRVRDNGAWLDPLKLKSITPDPLGGDSLRRFRNHVAQTLPKLDSDQRTLAENGQKRRALF